MPAGTSTRSVRSLTSRPRPSQRSHGCGGTLAVAAADVAVDRPHDLAEGRAADAAQDAVAAAALAGDDRRARLGAVAVAALAAVDRLVADVDRGAAGGVGEADVERDRDVAARWRARCARPAEERLEEVGDRAERVEVRRPAAVAQALVAVAVVDLAALGVGEDLVGLGGLLELLLGLRVVRVDVGMQLARELAEGLLDLHLVRVARDAEDLVGISGHGAQPSSYTSAMNRDSCRAASRTVPIAWP